MFTDCNSSRHRFECWRSPQVQSPAPPAQGSQVGGRRCDRWSDDSAQCSSETCPPMPSPPTLRAVAPILASGQKDSLTYRSPPAGTGCWPWWSRRGSLSPLELQLPAAPRPALGEATEASSASRSRDLANPMTSAPTAGLAKASGSCSRGTQPLCSQVHPSKSGVRGRGVYSGSNVEV